MTKPLIKNNTTTKKSQHQQQKPLQCLLHINYFGLHKVHSFDCWCSLNAFIKAEWKDILICYRNLTLWRCSENEHFLNCDPNYLLLYAYIAKWQGVSVFAGSWAGEWTWDWTPSQFGCPKGSPQVWETHQRADLPGMLGAVVTTGTLERNVVSQTVSKVASLFQWRMKESITQSFLIVGSFRGRRNISLGLPSSCLIYS